MPRSSFVADALVRRPPSRGLAILGVVAAALLAVWAADAAAAFAERLSLFHVGTSVYKRAQWASTACGMALAAGLACLASWLLGSSLRSAFGLPPGRRAHPAFTALRVVVGIPLLIWVSLWSSDEFFARRSAAAPLKALGLGLILCAMFAYDVPRLLRNALAALRTRVPLWRSLTPLDRLPVSGRVRTRGLVRAERALPGNAVYRWADGASEAVPFFLEAGGARIAVELDASRTVVETSAVDDSVAALLVDAEVEVIADVERPGGGDAYRGGPPRLVAGGDRLFVFTSGAGVNRRLVLAAAVELICALTLSAVTAGFILFWTILGARA
jgi:hypothetical protein